MTKRTSNPTAEQCKKTVAALSRSGVVIYRDLVAVKARKREGARTVYMHEYSTRGTKILGLPDGSILIPRNGPPLWGKV